MSNKTTHEIHIPQFGDDSSAEGNWKITGMMAEITTFNRGKVNHGKVTSLQLSGPILYTNKLEIPASPSSLDCGVENAK